MYKRFLIFSLFSITSLSIQGMELSGRSVLASYKLGNVKVRHNGMNYSVVSNDEEVDVPNHSVDALLRKMKPEHLEKFQDCGYIKVNKSDDGHYSLEGKVRGLGGGPVCAWWAYMFAKSTIYSSVAVAAATTVGAAVVATGGGVVPAAIAAGTVGKTVTAGAAGLAVSSTIAGGGAGAGIATAVGAANVGLAAGGLVAASGSSMGVVVAIEGASLGFGAIFAGPWCP